MQNQQDNPRYQELLNLRLFPPNAALVSAYFLETLAFYWHLTVIIDKANMPEIRFDNLLTLPWIDISCPTCFLRCLDPIDGIAIPQFALT